MGRRAYPLGLLSGAMRIWNACLRRRWRSCYRRHLHCVESHRGDVRSWPGAASCDWHTCLSPARLRSAARDPLRPLDETDRCDSFQLQCLLRHQTGRQSHSSVTPMTPPEEVEFERTIAVGLFVNSIGKYQIASRRFLTLTPHKPVQVCQTMPLFVRVFFAGVTSELA